MQIDTTTDFGKRVERRLREETMIWLTTVRRDGTPARGIACQGVSSRGTGG